MLSDEEKKELDNIKESPTYREVILLRVIEKQSKEIEELKEIAETLRKENVSLYIERRQNENKIKAKIEPVLKQLDTKMQEEYNKYGNSREYQDTVDAYNFLQSLLEKE